MTDREIDRLRALLRAALPCVEAELAMYDSMDRMEVAGDAGEEAAIVTSANRLHKLRADICEVLGL